MKRIITIMFVVSLSLLASMSCNKIDDYKDKPVSGMRGDDFINIFIINADSVNMLADSTPDHYDASQLKLEYEDMNGTRHNYGDAIKPFLYFDAESTNDIVSYPYGRANTTPATLGTGYNQTTCIMIEHANNYTYDEKGKINGSKNTYYLIYPNGQEDKIVANFYLSGVDLFLKELSINGILTFKKYSDHQYYNYDYYLFPFENVYYDTVDRKILFIVK